MINIDSRKEFRSTSFCDKMKELIYGPCCNNYMEYSQMQLWDYIIEFDALEILTTPSQNTNMQHVQENPSSFWN